MPEIHENAKILQLVRKNIITIIVNIIILLLLLVSLLLLKSLLLILLLLLLLLGCYFQQDAPQIAYRYWILELSDLSANQFKTVSFLSRQVSRIKVLPLCNPKVFTLKHTMCIKFCNVQLSFGFSPSNFWNTYCCYTHHDQDNICLMETAIFR